jgi:hypothetical protein
VEEGNTATMWRVSGIALKTSLHFHLLGIAAREDKIVPQAVVTILNQIYEVEADILLLFFYDPSDISSLRTDISAFC